MKKRNGIGWGLGMLVVLTALNLLGSGCGQQTAEDFFNRGKAKWKKGDLDGAIVDFTKAIELNPNYAKAYDRRGYAKRVWKVDLDGSIADYSKEIELNPNEAVAYKNRGDSKVDNGDTDGAIADFSKVIELNPKSFTAIIDDGASADFSDAFKLDPKYDAYISRGIAKMQKGDSDGAIADFSKAIELEPKFALGYHQRGITKKAKGDQVGADADFAQAAKLPEFQPPPLPSPSR